MSAGLARHRAVRQPAGTRTLLRLALLLATLTLYGCALWRAPPATDPATANALWAERQAALAAVSGFEATGRIAIKGGGLSGALRWQQQGEWFRLRIAGPFGAGATLIEGVPTAVKIKNKEIDLDTPEPQRVLLEATGWPLPLDALRWWVLGLPAPGEPANQVLLDADGRAIALEQRGWQLRYSDYRGANPKATPGRVEASQAGYSATVIFDTLQTAP